METRAHYVLIGAFMLGGIILSILFMLWLGSVERETDDYEVIFTQKISGLQEGANVLFNGIRVGEVAELRLDREDPNRSIALVQVEKGTPVKTDTRVELELVGVTGLAVVQFTGGSRSSPMLRDVSRDRIPQINADLTGIAAVLESSGDIVVNLQRLLNEENALSVSRILSDIEAVTDIVADKENEVGLIIDNLAVASNSLRKTAEGLESAIGRIDESAASVQRLIEEDGGATMAQLNEATANLNSLLANVDAMVEDNRPAIDAFAQDGLGTAVAMLTRANRLVSTTEAILLEFDRDPARFLLGEGRPSAD